MRQTTIGQAISVYGIGLHTGKVVNMGFHPAPANHGYKFQRTDLEGQPIIPADIQYVVSTNRGTTLALPDGSSVSTVEHTLAALVGLGSDNVLITMDGPEAPIMDGSSKPFTDLLETVDKVELEEEREYLIIRDTISYRDEETGSELMAMPSDHLEITALIDFNSPVLGQQFAALEDIDSFTKEIAPARTFVFVHELEQLMDQGLIKGGDLENAVVISNRFYDREELNRLAVKLGKQTVEINKEGVLNITDLRYKNEPARHKLLDIVGDLALVGRPILGKIVAKKPGHTVNRAFAGLLKKHLQEQRKLKGIPVIDPDAKPVMTHKDIIAKLPHRHPFLLVDKIMEISENHVVGIKNVTVNEAYFAGHFPCNPIMPGVLQIEAMAQTGGLLALKNVPEDEQWDTFFLKIDHCRFKQFVVPGDVLVMKLELLAPIRRGIVQMQGVAYVGNKIATEAELTAQIVKRNHDA
jgi:UDP-3-O-[3-hydroxymyristoyl] N-acetylglucosamine deacetylase / 3-hydroxyacyl-[acyl-carrier-protein] dehydratase